MAGAKTRRKNNFYFTLILNDLIDNWTSTSIVQLCASRASGRLSVLSCCAYLGQVDE